jgi:hypothetical protein
LSLEMVLADSVGDVALQRLLSSPGNALVHSQYRGALNLTTKGGMVSVVPANVGRGPMNIILKEERFRRSPALVQGTRLSLSEAGVDLEGFIVDYRDAPVYGPGPRFGRSPAGANRIGEYIAAAWGVLEASGNLGGMGGIALKVRGKWAPENVGSASRTAVEPTEGVLAALQSFDVDALASSALGLIGLGPGLTPAGDDFLSGMMITVALAAKNGLWREDAVDLLSVIPRSAKGRTTTLSQEYLGLAARGMGGERVRAAVESIFTGRGAEVRPRCLDLVEVGATSGTDLLAGALLGAETIVGVSGS